MLKRQTNKSLFGSAMLLICALVWGFAFVAQSTATEQINAVSFNGIRFAQATLALIVVVFISDLIAKKRGVKPLDFNKETIFGGIVCGAALLLAADIQQYGIAMTTVGKASFITVMYIVMVPIIGLVLMRKRPSALCSYAILLAVAGFYLMCVNEDFSLTKGDAVILACAFAFSLQIVATDVFSKDTDPLKLTLVQFMTCTALSLPLMGIYGFPTVADVKASMWALLYVGVVSAGIGITLQTVGQKYTEPSVATLLMSLESVVGIFGGIVILHEQYSFKELSGCLLVFIAVFLAEYKLPPRRLLKFERNSYATTQRTFSEAVRETLSSLKKQK